MSPNSCTNSCREIQNLSPNQQMREHLPGTPRADVECNFGLRFRLIGAASLAELIAGLSQACHPLHPQVIQVL